MGFEPIAIIGRGSVLPGGMGPEALWDAILAGADLLTPPPEGAWRLEPDRVTRSADGQLWSARAGYVTGFRFDPGGLALPPEQLAGLDPLVSWTLEAARQALHEAGHGSLGGSARAGLVLGNLSLPSRSLSRLAEWTWLKEQGLSERDHGLAPGPRPDPASRFMSGLPARLVAHALGLGGSVLALDAACASSLYAIKLACDSLHDGRADLMLAGAVQGTDPLFLFSGFRVLKALSPTGQSRPFHREADGLLPAEGAVIFALKRLADAEAAGDRIHGVIRGVGLSNDGGATGLLVPSADGQIRAMRDALMQAGLTPSDLSLIECHATGTPLGDATEIRSMSAVYGEVDDLPIGSLKSNLGHGLTVSGAAGLLKLLSAFAAGVRPPMRAVASPIAEIARTPFRLLEQPEPWEVDGVRRAAISSFGFGGNNAHLLAEEWEPGSGRRSYAPGGAAAAADSPPLLTASGDLALVGIGLLAGGAPGREAFRAALLRGGADRRPAGLGPISLSTQSLRFPPRDLAAGLPQQLAVLCAAEEALAQSGSLPAERTGVFIGMQCDAEICRHMARVRLQEWAPDWANQRGALVTPDWIGDAVAGLAGPLEPAAVLGLLPNIVANRLNAQFKLAGPSFSTSDEELSGTAALQVAARALRSGELDAAVVGAVDLAREPVQTAAALEVLPPDRQEPGDAAVVLVLKRLADAQQDGNQIVAVLTDQPGAGGDVNQPGAGGDMSLGFGPGAVNLTPRFGHAHAASGLLHLAAAALLCEGKALTEPAGARPWLTEGEPRTARIELDSLGGGRAELWLREGGGSAGVTVPGPFLLELYGGQDSGAVRAALASGRRTKEGPARLALVAADEGEMAERRRQAMEFLEGSRPGLPVGAFFHERPAGGELAFVFTGAGAAYHGMGRDLLLRRPDLLDGVSARIRSLRTAADWAYRCQAAEEPTPFEKLGGSSLLSQAHSVLSQRLMGLRPTAALGLSSGETNAVAALGAWNDLEGLFRELQQEGIYTRELGGGFDALRRAWNDPGAAWSGWRILLPAEQVRAAIADEPRVHLTLIHSPTDCAIGGDPAACERVLRRLGSERAMPLGYEMAVHCPELREVGEVWRRLHRRPTQPVPGVRFYSASASTPYTADSDRVADALLGMAMTTVDFPQMVRQAWEDGVRVFVEHGPRGLCSRWIGEILGDLEHLAVALDNPTVPGLLQAAYVAAQLLAAGVEVETAALFARPEAVAGPVLTFPAHLPPVRLPQFPSEQTMPQAPALPPVMAEWGAGPAPESGPVPQPELPGAALPANLSLWQQHQVGLLATAHREFLAQQSALHQQFLEARARSWGVLAAAVQAGALARGTQAAPRTVTAPPPAVPTPPPAVPPAPPAVPTAPPARPLFDRADLEQLAESRISSLLGPLFTRQDDYRRQVRMPMPPLLLADRVVAIHAEPGSMGTGSIITETDVTPDAWYLHDGYMPAGIQIEAGQADLLLCSWLGADFENRGERVYRLLGCELTYHGTRPRIGETIRYDIHIDRHARSGDVRLFFFHYDSTVAAEPRLSVRNGQAGFFSDAELATSGGVVWDSATSAPEPDSGGAPPLFQPTQRTFSPAQLKAFAEGRPYDCFGPGFEMAAAHVRSPRIQSGQMLLMDAVTDLAPRGGPWGRGYLRAIRQIRADDWFFPGHFKNDPTMPGTLMFEGGIQAMSFYLAALGFTIDRDGYRFEPVPEVPYKMVCRGQVVPTSRELVYELFIHGIEDGPEPVLWADILLTVDGLKAFHCRRMGLRLAPDWPMECLEAPADPNPQALPAPVVDGFVLDHASLMHCAWGRPSLAFGPRYAGFDGSRRLPRLPGPPYHFMTRITGVDGPMSTPRPGTTVEVEYDIPADAWYFAENGAPTMPFCILLEAALQPCGWLTAYMGIPLTNEGDLSFRNLNGNGTLLGEIRPGDGTLLTTVTCTDISRSGDTYIESFDVNCYLGDRPVYRLKTTFGHFPKASLASQVGIPFTEAERRELEEAPANVDVALKERCFTPALGTGKLALLDRVTGFWPAGGKAGKGRLRAEMDVDPRHWFFKAHFFQDPVQPGSIGLEAMLQLLQFYMAEQGMAEGIPVARFEPLALGRNLSWKYRGQVLPTRKRVLVEMEIMETGRDEAGPYAVAEAWLWVDGLRIYHAPNLALRIVSEATTDPPEEILDPAVQTWLADHRPTYTLPAVPMTFLADRLARAARTARPGSLVVGLRDVQVRGWLIADRPRRLTTEVIPSQQNPTAVDVTLLTWREASVAALSRFEPVAQGQILLDSRYPDPPSPWSPLADGERVDDPYESGALIHGPAFQILRELTLGSVGATALLDAGGGAVEPGLLGQLLLDGITHAIPNAELWRWSDAIGKDQVSYPTRILEAAFFGPTPTAGLVRCEVRFDGFHEDPAQPRFRVQLIAGERVWCALDLVARLFPKGPIGMLDGRERRAFLRDRAAIPGAGLSRQAEGATLLTPAEVRASDWLPGTISSLYGIGGTPAEMAEAIAAKEHVARQAGVHPSTVLLGTGLGQITARAPHLPATRFTLSVTERAGEVRVSDAEAPRADFSDALDYWRKRLGARNWPVEDMYFAMAERFVRRIVVTDPAGFERVKGRSALYLANHQVAVESFLFALLVPGMTRVPTVVLAKNEVRTRWLDEFLTHAEGYPGVSLPSFIMYLNQQDPAQVLQVFEDCRRQMITEGLSAMVHVEGTRSLTARRPVQQVSSSLLDMAMGAGAPIVPVRFVGGLPTEPLSSRLHIPVGHGSQDFWFGRPIFPEELQELPYARRRAAVLEAINGLGPGWQSEEPNPPAPGFQTEVREWTDRTGTSEEYSILLSALRRMRDPGEEMRRLLEGAASGRLKLERSGPGDWTAILARRLFGPQGPVVEQGGRG